jgi:hypothetical protein
MKIKKVTAGNKQPAGAIFPLDPRGKMAAVCPERCKDNLHL